jgi:hypothetical protein
LAKKRAIKELNLFKVNYNEYETIRRALGGKVCSNLLHLIAWIPYRGLFSDLERTLQEKNFLNAMKSGKWK